MKRICYLLICVAIVGASVACKSDSLMSEDESKAFNGKTNGGKRDEKAAQGIADFKKHFDETHGGPANAPASAKIPGQKS